MNATEADTETLTNETNSLTNHGEQLVPVGQNVNDVYIGSNQNMCQVECNDPSELCSTETYGLTNRCDPLFALSPFTQDDSATSCQGLNAVLQYESCDVIGGSCDQMFAVQKVQLCEYCKGRNKCREGCERPQLYFARKRPPFGDKSYGKDNHRTDDIVESTSNSNVTKKVIKEPSFQISRIFG